MIRRKILYVHYLPKKGGSAISLSLLLKNLDRQRFEPVVVLTQEGPIRNFFEALGIRVVHIPMSLIFDDTIRPIWDLKNYTNWLAFRSNRAFADFLQAEKPDIVHLNDYPLLSAGITAHQLEIPIVWHIRGVIPQDGNLRRKLLVKKIARLATRIVAVTEDEANQFGQSAHVSVIYNSVDMEAIEAARGTGWKFRSEINCDDDTILIGALIHLTPQKGAWDFIRAAGLTKAMCPDFNLKFIITGHVSKKRRKLHRIRDITGFIGLKHSLDYAWELARKSDVEDELVITGFRSDVLTIVDALDVVVFPSRLNSVGRAAIEGGALGKPVVATVPQKITGLVVDGKTGLIAPPANPRALADALVKLLRNPSLAHDMGKAGRVHSLEKFDAQRNIEPIHQIYEEILNADIGREENTR